MKFGFVIKGFAAGLDWNGRSLYGDFGRLQFALTVEENLPKLGQKIFKDAYPTPRGHQYAYAWQGGEFSFSIANKGMNEEPLFLQ